LVQMASSNAPMPFRYMAKQYHAHGWSPLPLPYKEKSPVPTGYTGATGKDVSEDDLRRWLRPRARVTVGNFNYPPGNVALRLPRGVLGIDVDAHSGKAGRETFEAALAEWGPLPPTWVTTSKVDSGSGIRLYRIPEGLAWPGELPFGKGVELIRWDHRFAIVFPSIHDKTGGEYGWNFEEDTDEYGERLGRLALVPRLDEFPAPADLAELPEMWVEGLTSNVKWSALAVGAEVDDAGAASWLASCVEPDLPCAFMRKTIASHTKLIRLSGEDGGAHDAGRDAAWAVLGDANEGHGGVSKALSKLRDVFLAAVRERRGDERQARGEWARAVFRGIAKIIEGGGQEHEDPCVATTLVDLTDNKPIFGFDEFSNATRLARVMGGRARWVPALDRWYIWDTVRWSPDMDGQVARWAWKAIASIDEEIAALGGTATDEDIAQFKKHQKSSSKLASLNSMIGLVKSRPGITLAAERLDADLRALNCPNGTVELGTTGAAFARVQRADQYLTLVTSAEYRPEATSGLWEKFLAHALPDEEVRSWAQRLVGYSLLGRNTERLFVVVYGPTSTGKTTFAETLRLVLGEYAASVNLSIFRDNQDERSRPDLVRALRRRLIFAEEASSSWHLHPDQVKRITGGSEITARLPHAREYLELIPPFTPWLLTNATPSIDGADDAFWRRTKVVPFTETVPVGEETVDLVARLTEPDSAAGVLAWAVAGWNAYTESRDLEQPPATWQLLQEFQSEASDFDRCFAEIAVMDPEAYEMARDIYAAYQQWCENHGIKPESETRVGRYLKGRGINKKSVRIDGHPRTPRAGIKLTKEWKNVVS
jgi:putative DNA primase/helicase